MCWQQRGATVVYATHIFDGLETWATDLVYVQDGTLKRSEKLPELAELKTSPNLLSVVETWLRSEIPIEKKKPSNHPSAVKKSSPFDNSPFRSTRHMAYYRWLPIQISVYHTTIKSSLGLVCKKSLLVTFFKFIWGNCLLSPYIILQNIQSFMPYSSYMYNNTNISGL